MLFYNVLAKFTTVSNWILSAWFKLTDLSPNNVHTFQLISKSAFSLHIEGTENGVKKMERVGVNICVTKRKGRLMTHWHALIFVSVEQAIICKITISMNIKYHLLCYPCQQNNLTSYTSNITTPISQRTINITTIIFSNTELRGTATKRI